MHHEPGYRFVECFQHVFKQMRTKQEQKNKNKHVAEGWYHVKIEMFEIPHFSSFEKATDLRIAPISKQ